jgi:integrase
MSDEIKVTVVAHGSKRKFLMLRYVDPCTGKRVQKSAETNDRKAATKAAGKWESELREGRYVAPVRMTWPAFRTRYENEVLSALAPDTDDKVSTVFNMIEKHLGPQRLTDFTASRLSHYQSKLREMKRSETTIKGHMVILKTALSWAVRMGLLAKVPSIEMPKRAKGQKMMKGRPITGEEFDRLLEAVPKVVVRDRAKPPQRGEWRPMTPDAEAKRAAVVAGWRFYLKGLWWSGLRLGESLELYWDRDDKLCVDLSGKHPMLRIPAGLEKGHQDRMHPIAPEFAELLMTIPEADRVGPVFGLQGRAMRLERMPKDSVIRLLSEIGRKAGVVVDKARGKYASAHDLRRSFGERWAARLMPQQLMELMRHETIETTMRYYVGRNAQSTASVLWAAHKLATGHTSGHTPDKNPAFTGE